MTRGRSRTGERPGIWLAITLAVILHGVMLLLPVAGEKQSPPDRQRPIEIELARARIPAHTSPEADVEPETESPQPVLEQLPEAVRPPLEHPPDKLAASTPANSLPPPAVTELPVPVPERDFAAMGEVEKKVLTSTILARQYITEESAVDRLFGKPLVQDSSDFEKDFRYPLRPDLVEMLNQPLPDLPFEYTPGLVYFAYDPGIKGDLQRFWDVITPEFGWRTKYGTEVRCALVLVIVGCVWK